MSEKIDSGFPEVVSVVVPAYNYGHFLGETLSDLQKQTYEHWECIIVDDGSTDNTQDVAKEWCLKDKRYRYIFQKNAGLSAARNTGIKNCIGTFIQLLDADDLLEADKFKNQLEIFNKVPQADIVYSEVRYFHTEAPNERRFSMSENDEPWMPCLSGKGQEILKKLLKMNIFVVNAALARKSVFDKVGAFNVKLKSVEDYEFWCRCAFKGIFFQYDNAPSSFALVRAHAVSMSKNKLTMNKASYQVRKLQDSLISKVSNKVSRLELEQIHFLEVRYLLRNMVDLYVENGNKSAAAKFQIKLLFLEKDVKSFLKGIISILFK